MATLSTIVKIVIVLFGYSIQLITFGFKLFLTTVYMRKSLLSNTTKQNRCDYLVFLVTLFFIQKSAATTFYINDNATKGDVYTTSIGNDSNDGITSANPKLSIWATYEKAQEGDTIIIDTGSYAELTTKGILSFDNTKKIIFIIAGVSDGVFAKTPLPVNQKVSPSEFYIVNDKPIERDAYMQRLRNGK